MDRFGIVLLTALVACGGGARAPATTSAAEPTAVPPSPSAAADALTVDECHAAYARWWDVPPCELGVECTISEKVLQQTVLGVGEQTRRARSCARLRPRAWYDCAMQAPTWKAWHACGPALLPAYRAVPAGKGPHRLERGVAYVIGRDILSLASIADGRATFVNIDSSTDEQHELVVETNGELDLTHEYPSDPPEASSLPPGFDLSPDAGVAPDAASSPDGLQVIALVRMGGPRFRVVAIAGDHVVLERLPPREIVIKQFH
ncbi:MAG: hypothetical protein K8M05_12605 [Deltaproteobacteria bacterium]|nr:hypothetical protein [Kofleriaceae bacterium]